MLEQTKRISFGISSVLYKVEPEQDLYTGSGQKVPASTPQHCLKSHTTKHFFLYNQTAGRRYRIRVRRKYEGIETMWQIKKTIKQGREKIYDEF